MNIPSKHCASTSDLKNCLERDDVYVFDVRKPEELGENKCNVIKAKVWANIPVTDVDLALDLPESEFQKKYNVSKPTNQSNIVFHCGLGGRSAKALGIALDKGYSNAKHYPGGYKKWKEES